MYTVVIVEDEWLVRLGIKTVIPWENYNMQVIADEDNGLSALKIIQEQKPDILLTDILMPQMSGEELIKQLSLENQIPYTIVITCLEDFHLVKELLSHGIRDYISKASITEEELGKCLLRAKNYLDQQSRPIAQNSKPAVDRMQVSSHILQNYFHENLSENEATEQLNKLGIPLENGQNLLALCPIEAVYDYQGNILKIPPTELYRNLYDLLLSLPFSNGSLYPFLIDEKYFLILFHQDANHSNTTTFDPADFNDLHTQIQQYLNIRLSFLLFKAGSSPVKLRTAFQKAISSLEVHYLNPSGSIIYDWEKPHMTPESIADICQPLRKHKDWILACSTFACAENFNKLIDQLEKDALLSQEAMTYSMLSISHYVNSLLNGQHADALALCDRLILRTPHLQDLIVTLNTFLASCEQYYLQYQKPHHRKEIRDALKFIESNMENPDLSLTTLAKQVGLSETYFSTLFKQELEQSFSRYLSNVRIERSKSLLEHTSLKLFDIAVQCGFSDEAYFSRVFKKSTGIAPSEWRSIWLQSLPENKV